jgi:hypothetical protein
LNCSNPIDAAILADYWSAALSGSDEQTVEEHLLDCDRCGDRLREVIALAEGVRELAREGSLRMVVNDAFLQRAMAEGLRIRQYAPALRRLPGVAHLCESRAITQDDRASGHVR